ncbi:MAG: right-handed parallel beta-helix repeat-containing protein [Verrucomicrobiota bacterium]
MRTFAFISGLLVFAGLVSCVPLEKERAIHTTHGVQPGIFFVATNGNDQWAGETPSPNPFQQKGPFQSLARALQAAAELKVAQGGQWHQPVSIFIRSGTHWLAEPVVITPKLSGTEQARLTIAAYSGERPLLSAGRLISNWKALTVDGKQLWAAPVPAARDAGWFFHQLWVKGERRQRARHPNKGYFTIASLPDATADWERGHSRLQFNSGDLKSWKSANQGEAVAMTRWVESRLPITIIDDEQNILASNKRSVFQLQPGDPFYVEGIFEVLDQPGEWFLDRTGTLFYMPLPGETLNNFVAVAPKLSECLRIEGHPESGKYVEHVQFRGLTFSHNEWFYPTNFGNTERHISTTPDPEIYGFAQAAFGVPGIVKAEGALNCSFEECEFSNVGSYGLQLGRGCQSNRVSHCNFSDLAAGGIRIGETILRTNALEQAHDNEIVDCNIFDGGKMFHSGEGIWIGQSFGNRIAHNSIHDFFYTGISLGWTWGYESSLASNNIVESNHVHHIGQKANGDGPILSDMGGIYTLGMQPGTIIRHNLWHDIEGLRYGGWGIYFDEGSSHILAENNVAFRTTHGGFHQHYGKENIVRNNVFAFGRDHQLQRTRAEEHVSFTFERNIVYFDHGKLLEGDWEHGKWNQDFNLYFDTRTNTLEKIPGGWDKWRANGHDVHSVIADPRFATTNLAHFKLEADSPALRLGFQVFDLKLVGPRKKKID